MDRLEELKIQLEFNRTAAQIGEAVQPLPAAGPSIAPGAGAQIASCRSCAVCPTATRRAAQRTAIFQMKKGRDNEIAARRFVAMSDHPMRLRRPNGTTISRSGSSGKSAKRKPRPALDGAKFAILPEYPSERNIKGQVPAQRQTSLWRKCEPAPRPKKEPRPRKSRLRIAHARPNLVRRYCEPDGHGQLATGSWHASGSSPAPH